MVAVYVDITEIVKHPIRTGIQRVEREAFRHWSGPLPTACVVDDLGQFVRLSPKVFEILCREPDGSHGQDPDHIDLARIVSAGEPVSYGEIKRLLNIELFFDPIRASAYIEAAASGVRIAWYLYDFLVFLRPEMFPAGTTRKCMHFLRALRSAGDRLAFLSAQTRDEYATRVGRQLSVLNRAPIFCPGADGLRLERQVFRVDRHAFVAFGTVEERKNPNALLDAFALLWAQGHDVELVVAGRISPDAGYARKFFERHANDPRLTVLDHPSDEVLRESLRHARAVVMPSETEGFGLPPYEAVYAGIPAVASARLPSAEYLPQGAILLPRMDAESIAGAVGSLLNDGAAERLWRGAATVALPSWKDFGRGLSEWAIDI